MQLPPLSLYIHIPWCVRKCPYCDFNSHQADAIPEQDYVRALISDLEFELPFVQGRPLQSIFFGGGTPSLFSVDSIVTILNEAEKRIPFASDIEITLEANPGTAEQAKFSGYRAAGVNRLSIGVQSFNDAQLQSLGRIHSSNEAIAAAKMAVAANFNNFNIDLMHGLPKQSQKSALSDLQQAIDLNPTHLSWYQLTIEPNTAFYSAPPILPPDDELGDIQQAGEQLLANNNYQHYEISAYCQSNKEAKHNQHYWLFGDFIGIGAGAHGKLTNIATENISRRWKTRAPQHYLAVNQQRLDNQFLAGEKLIEKSDLSLEFMMNALRLQSGFYISTYEHTTGLQFNNIEATINSLISQQLLQRESNIIRPTQKGFLFLNDVLAAF